MPPNLEQYAAVPLEGYSVDPSTIGLMKGLAGNLTNSTTAINKGVGSDMVGMTAPGASRSGLGGEDMSKSVMSALSERNNRRSGDFINTLKRDTAMQAPAREAEGMKQIVGNVQSLANVGLDNYKIRKQQKVNETRVEVYRQQQQNALVAGILGILGAIGGAAIGAATGGAGVAAAGALAGGKAGDK